MDAQEVFRRIYRTDHWKGGSGEGSTPDATASYRAVLTRVLAARDVRSVVDVGCGDWQVSGLVDWLGTSYFGVDVVPELIDANAKASPPECRFLCADARTARLPRADLLIVKDVLQHWPVADIKAFVERQRRRYRYLLVTNDVASVHCDQSALNADCELGAWRVIDLEAAPFGYPAAWRYDFDIRGEWTKRILLYVAAWYRPFAARRDGVTDRLRSITS